MVTIDLETLSYSGVVNLLAEEGYEKQDCIEEQLDDMRKFIYSYVLYNGNKVIDCIQYIEYCKQVIDDEYADDRLTWEPIRTKWKHSSV